MYCRCGAYVCGIICCRTEKDPKKCDGIWKNKAEGFLKIRRQNNDSF